MKKAISVILAVLMIFTLFACGTGATPASPSVSPSTEPSIAPSAEVSPAETVAPSGNTDVSANEDAIGFFQSGVDPASRKTYNIVFAYPRVMALMQNLTNAFEHYSKSLNYTLATTTGDGDIDVYLQNIEVLASKGADGFITNPDPATSERIKEVLDETGVPYMILLNSMSDSNGNAILPCATLDGFASGEAEIQWLYDNHKTYWGDIDTTQIGLINITWSANRDLQSRHDGALAKFNELLPTNTRIFSTDGLTGKMDSDTGYNLTSTIFAGNPEVKYWFVVSALEMYSQGAARAAESLKIDKNVLISCVGSDILRSEWDNGYDGSWVSCVAISDYAYVAPTISALIAQLDGTATPESLWASKRAPGEKYTIYYINNKIVTKDTYKAYFAEIEQTVTLES